MQNKGRGLQIQCVKCLINVLKAIFITVLNVLFLASAPFDEREAGSLISEQNIIIAQKRFIVWFFISEWKSDL